MQWCYVHCNNVVEVKLIAVSLEYKFYIHLKSLSTLNSRKLWVNMTQPSSSGQINKPHIPSHLRMTLNMVIIIITINLLTVLLGLLLISVVCFVFCFYF